MPSACGARSPGDGVTAARSLATASQITIADTRKRPKELVGTSVRRFRGCEQVRSPRAPPGPSLACLATCEPGSRGRPKDHSSDRSGGSTCPFGQDEDYGRTRCGHNGLVHELVAKSREVIPDLRADVDGLWIHSRGRYHAWVVCLPGS
jgi:hypothetical protein